LYLYVLPFFLLFHFAIPFLCLSYHHTAPHILAMAEDKFGLTLYHGSGAAVESWVLTKLSCVYRFFLLSDLRGCIIVR
jgi:hypothetical protein